MDALIGIDIGTSGIKALLLDADGNVLAARDAAYPLSTPHLGWAEQEPAHWWSGAQRALRELARAAEEQGARIAGLALSGQMNGAVLLDNDLVPVRPCIIWADARTASQCNEVHALVGREELTAIAGKLAVTGYTAPKLLWVREHEPELFARVRHLLLPKDFVRLCLTGELATDASDASNTLLFDIRSGEWCDSILEALDLDPAMLPAVMSSTAQTGTVSKEAARLTGVPRGTPVFAGAGDSSAEAMGCGLVKPGPVLSVVGSAGNISAACSVPVIDPQGSIHTGCHVSKGLWIITGVQQAAGLSVRWLVENLKLFEDVHVQYPELDPYGIVIEQAASTPPGSEGLLFLPYLTGERTPHLDPRARGVFFGIDIRHTRAHFARSVFEGVAFAQRDALELLHQLGLPAEYLIAAGGGGRSQYWRQILADTMGLPVMATGNEHGAAFGAALLAGVGTGVFSDIQEACRVSVHLAPVAAPEPANRKLYEDAYDLYRHLYPHLRPVFAGRPTGTAHVA